MSENERNALIDQLYKDYYKDVCEHCLKMINYESRLTSFVEDCVQEAFVRLMDEIDMLSPDVNRAGWLCNKAWNLLRTHIRSTKKQKRILLKNAVKLYKDPMDVDNEIDEWVQTDAFHEKLKKICQTSSEIEKKVLNSFFVQDESIAETAEKNNLSKNSVRSAIERIRRRIRKNRKSFFE